MKKYGCALQKRTKEVVDCKSKNTRHLYKIRILSLRFDGKSFYGQINSQYKHLQSKLASYNGAPFVTGGFETTKTEIFDTEAAQWQEAEAYPFATK